MFVFGGFSNTASVSVSDNTVKLMNGTVSQDIYGGYSYSGTATNNTVTISGGTVTGQVHGGYAAISGTATNNTVAISGSANISQVFMLYGGNTYSSSGDLRTGNTLHLDNWLGNTTASIANFEHYLFTLPADIAKEQSILTLTGSDSVDLGTNATVAVALSGKPTALGVGESVYLIDATGSTGSITGSVASPVSTFGATDYSFDVALENNKLLTATLRGKINQDKAGAYLYGASARLGALTSSADHLLTALDKQEPRYETPAEFRFRSFFSMRGDNIKTRTGSSIEHQGASFLLGGALDAENSLGALTAGVFVEGGIGNYDGYSRLGRGEGDTWHHGVGVFAKQTLAKYSRRLYLEGALRLGRAPRPTSTAKEAPPTCATTARATTHLRPSPVDTPGERYGKDRRGRKTLLRQRRLPARAPGRAVSPRSGQDAARARGPGLGIRVRRTRAG
jgi:hypothetical protein